MKLQPSTSLCLWLLTVIMIDTYSRKVISSILPSLLIQIHFLDKWSLFFSFQIYWHRQRQQEGILYAYASRWAVEVPQRHFLWIVYVQYQHLQAVFWSWMTCIRCYVPQTCSLRYRGIFYDESEFIVALAVALERTVFPFVKQYIEDKMAAECSYHLTFRAHFLSRRKRSVW